MTIAQLSDAEYSPKGNSAIKNEFAAATHFELAAEQGNIDAQPQYPIPAAVDAVRNGAGAARHPGMTPLGRNVEAPAPAWNRTERKTDA
jgi:hypothetical protein